MYIYIYIAHYFNCYTALLHLSLIFIYSLFNIFTVQRLFVYVSTVYEFLPEINVFIFDNLSQTIPLQKTTSDI